MRNLLVVLAVGALAGTAFGQIRFPGGFNGWDASAATDGVEAPAGVHTYVVPNQGSGQRFEFLALRSPWDFSDPSKVIPSGNQWLYTDAAGDATIVLNENSAGDGWLPDTNRLSVTFDPGAWTATGSFQDEVGAGGDWDNAAAATAMTPLGGGLYEFLANDLPVGSYAWKAVNTGSWDAIGADGISVNADNVNFDIVDAVNNDVRMVVDALGGRVKTEIIPEPAALSLLLLGAAVLLRRR